MAKFENIFGSVVREIREEKGYSQEAFADIAEIHRTYVSSIELGKVQVSIVVAFKISEALDVPLSKIFRKVELRISEE